MLEFVIFYIIFCFCFIFPPSAFVSAGLTVTSLCTPILGSEDLYFIRYHIRRTSATLIIHSFLPLGFYFWLFILEDRQALNLLKNPTWLIFFWGSLLLPLVTMFRVFLWKLNDWQSHPLAKSLKKYALNERQWTEVAFEIEAEFRRIDKVSISTNPVSKAVLTNTWIIKISPYSVKVAHQNHVTLSLLKNEEHNVSINSSTGAQFLSIQVEDIQNKEPLFTIRLNALDYADMVDRLQSPINNVRGIIINQDVNSRFYQVFINEVEQNPVYQSSEEMDFCLGCMQRRANTRLVRRCIADMAGCTPCFCRPMWCLSCLAKWFAARQDAEHPETWLSSRCPCPTCRNPFCILDVSLIEQVDSI